MDATAKRETERVLPTEPRAQGDIIRIDHTSTEGGPVLGVIINADCDLVNGKLDGVLAYLPMYPFKEYVARFWAPGYIAEVLASATNKVIDIIGDDGAAAENLHSWIVTDGPAAVSEALTASTRLKKGQATSIYQEVRKLAVALDNRVAPFSRFLSLCRTEQDASAYARRQLAAARKAMGDGHFQISDLVEHPGIGFVIRMRRIYTIPEGNCFPSVSEQLARSGAAETTAVRIGRLTEIYRFKVAQLFAQQFSRIGLPDEVTALASLAIDDIVAEVEKDSE
ncbi:MAG: hypothetical protein ABTQ31_15990 [Rhizobiaceae bacterium]